MKSAETCSCSLCNNFYTYFHHHIVVLDKYIQSNLVYYKHNGDEEPYEHTCVIEIEQSEFSTFSEKCTNCSYSVLYRPYNELRNGK